MKILLISLNRSNWAAIYRGAADRGTVHCGRHQAPDPTEATLSWREPRQERRIFYLRDKQ
jgi:hypothetical protein